MAAIHNGSGQLDGRKGRIMRTETQHPLVTRYLKDLDRALRDVPAEGRHEIVAEIKEHIAEAAIDRGGEMTENELRTILDHVGHPEAIAEDARERYGVQRRRGGAMEGIAIFSLLLGGLVFPVVGWIFGVVLLWASDVWSIRDKILGTLVVPGGLAAPIALAGFAVAASGCVLPVAGCEPRETPAFLSAIVLILIAIAPIGVAAYLGRKAFRVR